MESKYPYHYQGSFPELSLDERPLQLLELEKLANRNPFDELFNLKKKLVARIGVGMLLVLLHLLDICFPGILFINDVYFQVLLFILLLYYIAYHYSILRKAGFEFITALRLTSFLQKWEVLMSDYIFTAVPASLLAGFYLVFVLKKSLPARLLFPYAHNSLLAVLEGFIFSGLIYWAVNKYGFIKPRRMLNAIRSLREEIAATYNEPAKNPGGHKHS